MNRRKICVITTSRADYGSLSCLMREVKKDQDLKLQVVATGGHLLKEFGNTFREIEKDGFKLEGKVPMLLSKDDEISIINSIGQGCGMFASIFQQLRPDLIVILGDRFELLPITIAALIMKIPVAHLSGGELTEGAIDDSIRHAVTKMSTYHFPAAEVYRQRVIQLGERPETVFNYGHIGLDNVRHLKLLDRQELETLLGLKLSGKIAIVTYHPVTLEDKTAQFQIENLLAAINSFDIKVVFTKANCDSGGRIINRKIKEFCARNKSKYRFFDNLGHLKYLSCLKHFDVVIGNSSSGLFEAPSFKIPVVNIGDRQRGRIRSGNVIDTGYAAEEIKKGLAKALSKSFCKMMKGVVNPYEKKGVKNASRAIKNRLKKLSISRSMLKKSFYDLNFMAVK